MKNTQGSEGGKNQIVAPKEQRKWQEEYMEGRRGSRGCAGIGQSPGRVLASLPLLLGVPPCPSPGGNGRRWHPSPQPFTAQEGVGHKAAPNSSVWVPGLSPAVFCPWLEDAGGHVWGLELNLGAKNSKRRHLHGVSQLQEHTWGRQTKPDQYNFV